MKVFFAFILSLLLLGTTGQAAPDYSAVDAIFSKHCLDCHASQDPDAKLVLESFETLVKGSENGPVIVPGKTDGSRLVEAIEGTLLHNGKQIIMPPGRKRAKLKPEEIAIVKAWISAGALAPATPKALVTELNVPKIRVEGTPRNPINALIHLPGTNLIAVGRYRQVELRSDQSGELLRALAGHHGNVNALALSPDGKHLFAASGEDALFGEVKEWNVADGKLVRTIHGHKDTIYALAVSPDGKTLATGSYDQKIKLWDISTGKELNTLSGHNGCVYCLSFRPDGKILASASGDHTVKLWDVATGARRDTLSQPLKDVFAVAFSPDGSKLVAAGVDNRIRIWQISATAAETTNPLLDSKFAAEGSILRLVFSSDGKLLLSSADDRTVRLWDAVNMKEQVLLEKQPDWAAGLDFVSDNKSIAIGRLDGSLAFYALDGKPLKSTVAMTAPASASSPKAMKKKKGAKPPPSDKPEIAQIWPRGMQRGTELIVKLTGTNFLGLTAVNTSNPKLLAIITNEASSTGTNSWLRLKAAADLPDGGYDISLSNEKGTGSPVKLYVDSFPNFVETESNKPGTVRPVSWPLSYWGQLNPGGDVDELEFSARAGVNLVFDLAAKNIGSKAEAYLTLLDAHGNILASQGEFDGGDPLLSFPVKTNGVYRIRVTEVTDGGSPDFYYRLTMGQLPEVIGIFPPSVRTNKSAEVQLIGYNLAGRDKVSVKPAKAGELDLPLPADKYRTRRGFKVLVAENPVLMETEPNDTPATANVIPVPGTVCGRIYSTNEESDSDLFRFEAKAGRDLILETDAARRGSPIDTKIEVLHPNGQPVQRLQFRAVRDSAINFRGIDSGSPDIRIDNWQEMELNQYLYMEGEVCRLFRMPQGPDSGFLFYTSAGRRRDYFDTSATDHALDEPCYIVEPHPPGEMLQPNGLPVFPLNYVNDDDGDRQLGTDSRLHFIAPTNGSYLVRVTDNRGRSGPRFSYQLTVREARPDFTVTLNGGSPSISPGTGRDFSVSANRIDNFDGDIRVDVSGTPPGFRVSSPIVIQAGHSDAQGVINCDENAVAPKTTELAQIKVTATAVVDGKEVTKPVNSFDKITLGEKAKLLVACEPYDPAATNFVVRSVKDKPLEITMAPGEILPVWLKIDRRGHDDLATFTGENLPHGVIIDNIGLNGVLIPKEESRRQIFLRAAKWVPDTDRLFYIKAAQAGNPSSLPVVIHIRRNALQTASASKQLESLR
jgi:WD40 repeat protein